MKKSYEEDAALSVSPKPVFPQPSSELMSMNGSKMQSRIQNRRISTETMGRTKKSEESQTRDLREVASGTVQLE